MEAVDTPADRGAGRRRKRALGIATLAAAALLIAGAGAGLLARRAARVREAVRAIEAAGGVVTWDYELAGLPDGVRTVSEVIDSRDREDLDADGRAWLRRLLGPEWLHDVAAVSFFPRYDLKWSPEDGASLSDMLAAHLPAFPMLKELVLLEEQATDRTLQAAGGLGDLESLTVHGAGVTDEGLLHLRGLSRLRTLHVNSSRITDWGLEHLKGLTGLEVLSLLGGRITDEGARHLTALEKLETLALENAQITDGAIEALLELKNLRSLHVNSTRITENGIEMLRAGLPGLRVDH